MRASTAIAVLLFVAAGAFAQDAAPTPAPSPDYSRDSLMRLFTAGEERPRVEPRVRYHVGSIDVRALGTTWRIVYLPILMPLHGTRPMVNREFPDPFALTGTAIATPPRAWRTQRRYTAELRRIDRMEKRRRAKIGVR